MKIYTHDYAGHAFIGELSRNLAARGHQVIHIYGAHNPTPKGFLELLPGDPESLSFYPIKLSTPFQKYSFLKRWRQEIEYGNKLAAAVREIQPDLVLSAQTPLDAEYRLHKACLSAGIPRIHWLQDLIGIATWKILRKKIPVLGELIGRYYIAVEKTLLKNADLIVAITDDFVPLLRDWNIPDENITVFPNWPTLEHIPVLQKDNAWSRENALEGYFVFLYTGTLGFKHNPQLLLALAQEFISSKSVKIVVVSEGPGADWLRDQKRKNNLHNIIILPYQPVERYAEVLASGDVLIGNLNADAGMYSVPSKILSYLCAGKPILFSMPEENQAAKMITTNKAGFGVNPDDQEGFIKGAQRLLADHALCLELARNGREYAEDNFNIARIGDRFDQIVNMLV
jgi:colanic acid biosynthesis glycosyl transferase WcaI